MTRETDEEAWTWDYSGTIVRVKVKGPSGSNITVVSLDSKNSFERRPSELFHFERDAINGWIAYLASDVVRLWGALDRAKGLFREAVIQRDSFNARSA